MDAIDSSNDAITVTVPASANFIHVIRSVVAGVAARMDLTVDAIDDLRLLVDEAASALLARRPAAERLAVRIEPGAELLSVVASTYPPDGASPDLRLEDTLAWHVLSALADHVGVTTVDGGPAIAFAKRVRSPMRRE
jgi:serine/threonine-protein kinase RsbW